MKPTRIAVFALVLLGTAGATEAQQSAGGIEIPQLTPDQRWGRAAGHADAFMVAAIAYAKSKGDDPEAFGRSIGRSFAPLWAHSGNATVGRVARNIAANFQYWPEGGVEIVEQSPQSVTLRIRRAWARGFTPGGGTGGLNTGANTSGVTVDEFERVIGVVHEEITKHLGLRFQQHREGDALLMTITDPREPVARR